MFNDAVLTSLRGGPHVLGVTLGLNQVSRGRELELNMKLQG